MSGTGVVSEDESALEIEREIDGNECRLFLAGELDILSAPKLQEAIAAACVNGTSSVTLDLAGVRFVDSSGVRVLRQGQQLCRERRCEFALRNLQGQAHRLFEVMSLFEHFSISSGP